MRPGLEASTGNMPVDILLEVGHKITKGNKTIGYLPPKTTITIEDQIMGKDFLAYEIKYTNEFGNQLRGYILYGSPGLEIKAIK